MIIQTCKQVSTTMTRLMHVQAQNNAMEENKTKYQIAMKHGCVSRLGCGCGCGCGTRQFLKKVGAGAAGPGD